MSLFTNQQNIAIAICTPHRMFTEGGRFRFDTVSVPWQRARQALHMPTNINTCEIFADGLEIGCARSAVAAQVLDHKPAPPTFLLFLDDDVIVPADALVKLLFRAKTHPQYDVYAGVYCLKRPALPEPLIYGDNGQGPLWDWTVGDLLTTERDGVKAVHCGLTLIRTSVFQRLKDAGLVKGDGADMDNEPFFKTIHEDHKNEEGVLCRQEGTEDIYFCHKLAQLGGKILVDTSVLAGHIDKDTGVVYGLPLDYGPAHRAKWLARKDGKTADRVEAEGQKLALDLGAGGERREWPGHVTYTTDVRQESAPDYVQDTLLLNLPDNHYDLCASSHHLEHLGRWDQERAWSEIFRVTKPGGKIEHIVPSGDWAACKIGEGEVDRFVMDVVVGAQEAFGYDRAWNVHAFLYVKTIAQALAEQAGFVNVTCEDWRDNEANGFNLVIKGDKPLPVSRNGEGENHEAEQVCGREAGEAGGGANGCQGAEAAAGHDPGAGREDRLQLRDDGDGAGRTAEVPAAD